MSIRETVPGLENDEKLIDDGQCLHYFAETCLEAETQC